MPRRYQSGTLKLIQQVYDYLDAHGPIVGVPNVYAIARLIGISSYEMTRVVSIVRSPEWIDQHHWTIPFVSKGLATKTYSVEHVVGQTVRLRNGNQRKSDEVETHLRRNLAGLVLETELATGKEQQRAKILAAAAHSAIVMLDAAK